jgi:hypothetical protein
MAHVRRKGIAGPWVELERTLDYKPPTAAKDAHVEGYLTSKNGPSGPSSLGSHRVAALPGWHSFARGSNSSTFASTLVSLFHLALRANSRGVAPLQFASTFVRCPH